MRKKLKAGVIALTAAALMAMSPAAALADTIIIPVNPDGTQQTQAAQPETQAPPDYLPDTEHYIEVKVEPGDLLGEPAWNEEKYTSSGDREKNNQRRNRHETPLRLNQDIRT